ncbi:hypothetical protein [Falsochrobactrum tianjinense]|nr:hypothetical protein [Falsochrobactrum sp. TDYN1]
MMIYPIHDYHGHRIGTIMTEDSGNPDDRWVAYAIHDERQTFPSWEAARTWIEVIASEYRTDI